MALAGVRGMAQATNSQTKAGTAGKKKLSASLFIKKEVGLRIIRIGFGWMEFLQKLQGEQLAALSRRWIIWSAVTAKYTRVCMQVGIAEMRREAKR